MLSQVELFTLLGTILSFFIPSLQFCSCMCIYGYHVSMSEVLELSMKVFFPVSLNWSEYFWEERLAKFGYLCDQSPFIAIFQMVQCKLLIQVSLSHWNLLIFSHINFQDLRVSLNFLFAVNLCSNPEDKLQIYRDNFEKAYLDSTERFYRTQAPSYLQQNGVQNYMKYVSKNSVVPLYWKC